MQRAQIFTGWPAVRALPGRAEAARWIAPALLALLLAGAALQIASHPKPAVWDQARLLQARFEAPYAPAPPYGFTSQLVVIALRAALPEPVPLHEALRVFAMAFWVLSASWLAAALLERPVTWALFVLLLFASQYPFLWLSSELITGGLLCLCLGAWVRGAPPLLLGALLAGLALCKMELGLVAGVLLAYWVHAARTPRERALLAGGAAGALLVLLLPGLLAFGPGYLVSYGDDGQSRAFATFRQHFAALVAPLQWTPGPPPWDHPDPYVQRVFPGAASLGDVVRTPGLPYLDFVALSVSRGVRKLGWLFQWGWLAAALLAWTRRRGGVALDSREKALLLSFVGCLPFVLVSYPHIRYFARYYPVFWLLVLLSLERVSRLEAAGPRRAALAATGATLLALAWSAERAAVGLAAAPHLSLYWFSD